MLFLVETPQGSPSGTLVHANALATLQQADIPTNDDYVSVSFQPFTLEANTTYWLVLKRTVEPGPISARIIGTGNKTLPVTTAALRNITTDLGINLLGRTLFLK